MVEALWVQRQLVALHILCSYSDHPTFQNPAGPVQSFWSLTSEKQTPIFYSIHSAFLVCNTTWWTINFFNEISNKDHGQWNSKSEQKVYAPHYPYGNIKCQYLIHVRGPSLIITRGAIEKWGRGHKFHTPSNRKGVIKSRPPDRGATNS